MNQNLERKLVKKVFQKIVLHKNHVLEKFDKNAFNYCHFKEQKILNKMSDRPVRHIVPLQSYQHQKNQKNMFLADF